MKTTPDFHKFPLYFTFVYIVLHDFIEKKILSYIQSFLVFPQTSLEQVCIQPIKSLSVPGIQSDVTDLVKPRRHGGDQETACRRAARTGMVCLDHGKTRGKPWENGDFIRWFHWTSSWFMMAKLVSISSLSMISGLLWFIFHDMIYL